MKRWRPFVLCSALAIAGIVLFLAYSMWMEPAIHLNRWQSQIISKLEAAKTEDDVRTLTRPLGVYIQRADASWIAICYHDTHSGGIASRAIALDSGGAWFRSRYHFCGELKYFQEWLDAQLSPEASRMSPERALMS